VRELLAAQARMQSIAGTGSPSMDGATPYRTPPSKDPCSSDTFTTPPPPPRRTPCATKTDHPESNVLSVDRIDFCNEYRPWETGEPLKYGDLFDK
jgi:hypothetical protein